MKVEGTCKEDVAGSSPAGGAMKIIVFLLSLFVLLGIATTTVEAKSYIRSYSRSSGVRVRSYTRYKADGYKFNNYVYRSDRGYRR